MQHTHTHNTIKLCRWSTDLCKNLFFVVQTKMRVFFFVVVFRTLAGKWQSEIDATNYWVQHVWSQCVAYCRAPKTVNHGRVCAVCAVYNNIAGDSTVYSRESKRERERYQMPATWHCCISCAHHACVCVRAHTLLISHNEAINQNKIKKCESLRVAWEKHVPCT